MKPRSDPRSGLLQVRGNTIYVDRLLICGPTLHVNTQQSFIFSDFICLKTHILLFFNFHFMPVDSCKHTSGL